MCIYYTRPETLSIQKEETLSFNTVHRSCTLAALPEGTVAISYSESHLTEKWYTDDARRFDPMVSLFGKESGVLKQHRCVLTYSFNHSHVHISNLLHIMLAFICILLINQEGEREKTVMRCVIQEMHIPDFKCGASEIVGILDVGTVNHPV